MTDATIIQGAIASLKSAAEIIKIVYAAKIDIDTKEKVSQLQQLVWSARELAYNAQDELAEIKKIASEHERQVVEMKKWGEDKARYRLFQPLDLHGFVYGLHSSDAMGEPPHYICANCYQVGRKSILNNEKSKEGWTLIACPQCKSAIPTGNRGYVPSVYIPD